jgi:Mce-associated membrane protein
MTVDQDSRIEDSGDVNADEDGAAVEPPDEQRGHRWLKTVMRGKAVVLRTLSALLARWRVISLTLAVVVALGLTAALFTVQYRPDQQTDDASARAAIKAASEGTVALLSYTPQTVDNDLAAAKSHLTGEYLRYFGDFGRYFLAPAVRQRDVKASASVVRTGVVEIRPNSAVVLEFVHQVTTSKDKPEPVLTTNNVRVTLSKIEGTWLITKFEPE